MLIGFRRIGFGSILRVGGVRIAGFIPIGFAVGRIRIIGTDMGLMITTGFFVGALVMIGFTVGFFKGFFVGFFKGCTLGFSIGLTLGGGNAEAVSMIIMQSMVNVMVRKLFR